jgi:hypothetical protein
MRTDQRYRRDGGKAVAIRKLQIDDHEVEIGIFGEARNAFV